MTTTTKNEIRFTDTDLAWLDPNLDGQITEDEIRDVKRMVPEDKDALTVQKEDMRAAFKNLTADLKEKGSITYFKNTEGFSLQPNRQNLVWATQIAGQSGDSQVASLEEVVLSLQEGAPSPCYKKIIPQVYVGEDGHLYILKGSQLEKQELPQEKPFILKGVNAVIYDSEQPSSYHSKNKTWVILYADPQQGLVQFLFDPPSSLLLSEKKDWSSIQIDRVAGGKAYAIFADDRSQLSPAAGHLYTLEGKPYEDGFSVNINLGVPEVLSHNGQEILCPPKADGACYDVATGEKIHQLYNHVKSDGSSHLIDLTKGTVSDTSSNLRTYDLSQTTLKLQTPGQTLNDVLLPDGNKGRFQNEYTQSDCILYTATKQSGGKMKVEWISLETNTVLLTYTVKPIPVPGRYEAPKPTTGVLFLEKSESANRDFQFSLGEGSKSWTDVSRGPRMPITLSGKLFPEEVTILDRENDLWWASESRKVYSGDGKLILTVPEADEFFPLEHNGQWYTVCLREGSNNHVTIAVYDSKQRMLGDSTIYSSSYRTYEVFNEIEYDKLDSENKLLIPRMASDDKPQHKEIKLR